MPYIDELKGKMRTAAFGFISILVLVSATQAQKDWCDQVPPANVKKVVYCESLPIGTMPQGYAVSLESKFFDGLRRTTAKGQIRFQKDGREVLAYPNSFLVAVENSLLISATGSVMPDNPTRPTKVVLRWLNSSGIIREVTAALQQVQEPWPELNPPKVWYRAKIDGAPEPLNSELEVTLFGDKGELLGKLIRFL